LLALVDQRLLEASSLVWTSKFNAASAEEACDDIYKVPKLDQGYKKRYQGLLLLTLILTKLRANRLLNIEVTYFT
jgi:hypothetical protein